MNTETLIHDLALQCRPVKPVGHPIKRFLIWIAFTALFLIAGVWFLRPRPDIWNVAISPAFVFPALAMICVSIIATLSAFVLTIPDNRNRRFDIFPLTVLTVWFGLIAYMFASSDVANSRPGLICILRITGLAAVPTGLLFYMLKKAAPMKSGLVGLLAVLGSLSFAEIAVQVLCRKSEDVTHVIVWHFTPVCIIAAVGLLIGHVTFRWDVNK